MSLMVPMVPTALSRATPAGARCGRRLAVLTFLILLILAYSVPAPPRSGRRTYREQ